MKYFHCHSLPSVDSRRAVVSFWRKDVHKYPVSILYKSIAGRYRPVRVADGPITVRYRFIKNASWGTG